MMLDLQEAFDAGFEAVREYVDAFETKINARLDAMAKRLDELASIEAIQGQQGEKGEKGEKGDPGRDGADIVDFVRGENGHIVVTLSNGAVRDLGSFKGDKGEKGAPGERGLDGKDGEPGPVGEKGLDGKDGVDGRDGQNGVDGAKGEKGDPGADGLGFDDLRVEYDGERALSFVFEREGALKSFDVKLPIPIYREPYHPGKSYERGDGVSHGGSAWIAQKDTSAKPGENGDWKLIVKRGRDGQRGPEGKPGKDHGTPFADRDDG